MASTLFSADTQGFLRQFIHATKQPELVPTYLHYIEYLFQLKPVLFTPEKTVYRSAEEALTQLEKDGKIWRETEIKIGFAPATVDENTKKIYICPFTGKVFGDNTHPNPQDAIYEWVSTCPENTERVGGLRVKRFFVSEDPQIIASYAKSARPKAPITKIVYSSALNNKLFHSKDSVIEDTRASYLKKVSLSEVQSQTRFQIEQSFMEFIQAQLSDEKIASFIEALSEISEFTPLVEKWLVEFEQEG